MKVAAVQLGLYPDDPDKAVAEVQLLVADAATRGARLICLPEHWLLSRVITSDDVVLERLSGLARRHGVHLNLGANYEKRGRATYLTSHTISPSGRVISRQDKAHLYRRETRAAVAGSGFNLVEVDSVRVGILVCHDAVFPEAARTVALMGAELLVVPSMITAVGSQPWLAYLRARALENRVPIVSPNVLHPPRFLGGSCIIGLDYDKKDHVMKLVERKARSRRGSLVVDLKFGTNAAFRRERLRELVRSDAIARLYSAAKSYD